MNTLKNRTTIATTALLAAMLAGCNSNERGENMTIGEKTDQMINEAKETSQDVAHATKEAWNSFSEYTVEKKDQAAAFIDQQVATLGEEIEDLKDSASDSADEKTAAAINTLEEKKRELALQAKKIKNATAETWADVKNETHEKWNDFTEYLRETKNDLQTS